MPNLNDDPLSVPADMIPLRPKELALVLITEPVLISALCMLTFLLLWCNPILQWGCFTPLANDLEE